MTLVPCYTSSLFFFSDPCSGLPCYTSSFFSRTLVLPLASCSLWVLFSFSSYPCSSASSVLFLFLFWLLGSCIPFHSLFCSSLIFSRFGSSSSPFIFLVWLLPGSSSFLSWFSSMSPHQVLFLRARLTLPSCLSTAEPQVCACNAPSISPLPFFAPKARPTPRRSGLSRQAPGLLLLPMA